MNPWLKSLFEEHTALEKEIENQIKTAFPIGCRVSYSWGKTLRAGTVQGHLYRGDLRVLNTATGKTTDVHIGRYSEVERL
jgi:hypothetical protein